MRRVLTVAVASALAASALVGCTKKTHTTAVVTPTPSAPVSSVAIPVPEPSSAAPPSSAVSTKPAAAVLPAGCPELLPLVTVQQALGVALFGEVTYLRAAPVPQSGRTGRVTCSYGTQATPGIASPAPTPTASPTGRTPPAKPSAGTTTPSATPAAAPLVQVSYITYVDAKTAAARVALTVQTDGAHAVITPVKVNGKPASVLIGPTENELLMSDGARTIVVEVSPTVLPAAKAPGALATMAAAMLAFGSPGSTGSAGSAGSVGSAGAAASSP